MKTGVFHSWGLYTSFNEGALAAAPGEILHLFQLLHSKLWQLPMSTKPRTALLSLFIVFSLLISCRQNYRHAKQVKRAVYHWKNDETLDYSGLELLQQHNIHRVYVKLMDIDWNDERGAVPLSINKLEQFEAYNHQARDMTLDFVPVIFITNKVFSRIDSADIPLFATRVLRKCFTAYDPTDISSEEDGFNYYPQRYKASPAEIQFDCDWTVSTARKYFYFLQTIKKLLPNDSTKLSATIRLHQYKYPGKTGVPPVNRGMLMVYNMSDLTKYNAVNSIFDYDKAKQYFSSQNDYALPLDVALPAYAWGVVYRGKKFFSLKHGLTTGSVKGSDCFQQKAKHLYVVKKDTLLNELFLRPGDEIKFEGIDEENLMQAVTLARKALNNDTLTVSFFELNSPTFLKYQHETIEQVFNSFR